MTTIFPLLYVHLLESLFPVYNAIYNILIGLHAKETPSQMPNAKMPTNRKGIGIIKFLIVEKKKLYGFSFYRILS